MKKNEVAEILNTIKFYDTFETFVNRAYPEINYGKRIGIISFHNLFDADANYTFNGENPSFDYSIWTNILNSKESTEEELFVTILKIFDWGKVLDGNVESVISLYESKQLKQYISKIVNTLQKDITLGTQHDFGMDVLWSSGWTKVYSFINPNIVIYDSRVSAFLNHLLSTTFQNLSPSERESFFRLSKHLFNFGGAVNRERKVNKELGFRNYHPKGIYGFNANIIASWIIQLTKEQLEIRQEIRAFERAFFMLGFDLNQIT